MKPATMFLAASTVSLAIAVAYLGHALVEARAATDDAARLASFLGARVTELQRSRAAQSPSPMTRPGAPAAPPAGAAPANANANAQLTADQQFQEASVLRGQYAQRLQSPALQRVMRAQLRTGAKRMYSDFAAEHNLTAGEAAALYDLLARAQADPDFDPALAAADDRTREALTREGELEVERELVTLLGQTRAARLHEYQDTFEARGQITALEDQLAGVDQPMSEDQRRRLVRAALQDAEQFPTPGFEANQSPEQMIQVYGNWQRDRGERLAAAARSILTPQQMQQFDDLREMQNVLQNGGATN